MVHTTLVTRGIANLVVLALVGCVGENPDWDRRTTDTSGSLTDTADTQADPSDGPPDGADTQADPSTESSTTDASESSGVPDGTSDGTSTEPNTSEDPACPDPAQICNGVCAEIWKDKHACGTECIDCTALYGNHAKCKEGVCEP